MNRLFKAGYKKEVKIAKYSPLSYGRTCVYRAVLRTNELTNELSKENAVTLISFRYDVSIPLQYLK